MVQKQGGENHFYIKRKENPAVHWWLCRPAAGWKTSLTPGNITGFLTYQCYCTTISVTKKFNQSFNLLTTTVHTSYSLHSLPLSEISNTFEDTEEFTEQRYWVSSLTVHPSACRWLVAHCRCWRLISSQRLTAGSIWLRTRAESWRLSVWSSTPSWTSWDTFKDRVWRSPPPDPSITAPLS